MLNLTTEMVTTWYKVRLVNSCFYFYFDPAEQVYSQVYSQSPVDNNFESGDFSPWFDTSTGNVGWFVQNIDEAPPPASGSKILRIKPRVIGGPGGGLAALDGPLVTVSPGDELRFDFWIRSRVTAANDLQVNT